MEEFTVLVFAAGMGSRFGGLKQMQVVGPTNEFILDYSIYDAIKAGFNKVVFVIKEEMFEDFRNTIGKRIEDKIKVEYVFQKLNDLPSSIKLPEDRIKPLGTAHAVYAARNNINGKFITINADDFYGYDAFKKSFDVLNDLKDDEYAIISYKALNTITENGAVKRGVVFTKDGYLENMIESEVKEEDGKLLCSPLDGSEKFYTELDNPVSMNLFCLNRKLMDFIINDIESFFLDNNDLEKCEYLIPDVVNASAKFNNKKIRVDNTDSKYYGITYKDDLPSLIDGINNEISKGNYNKNLWG